MFNEPAKELEAVAPVWVKIPEIEAAPPTSNEVLVSPPALMPSLELESISKLEETLTPPEKSVKPVKALVEVPVWV